MVDIPATEVQEAKAMSARLIIEDLGAEFCEHMRQQGLDVVLENPDRVMRQGMLADELLWIAANTGFTNAEFIAKANELRVLLNNALTHGECSKLICASLGWWSRTAALYARRDYAEKQGFDEEDEGFYPNRWHEAKLEAARIELQLDKPLKGKQAAELFREPLEDLLKRPVPDGHDTPVGRHHDYGSVLGLLYIVATQQTLVRRHADDIARRIRRLSNSFLGVSVGYHLVAMALGYENWNNVLAALDDDCFTNKRLA